MTCILFIGDKTKTMKKFIYFNELEQRIEAAPINEGNFYYLGKYSEKKINRLYTFLGSIEGKEIISAFWFSELLSEGTKDLEKRYYQLKADKDRYEAVRERNEVCSTFMESANEADNMIDFWNKKRLNKNRPSISISIDVDFEKEEVHINHD